MAANGIADFPSLEIYYEQRLLALLSQAAANAQPFASRRVVVWEEAFFNIGEYGAGPGAGAATRG
jgi:hypothetical protein